MGIWKGECCHTLNERRPDKRLNGTNLTLAAPVHLCTTMATPWITAGAPKNVFLHGKRAEAARVAAKQPPHQQLWQRHVLRRDSDNAPVPVLCENQRNKILKLQKFWRFGRYVERCPIRIRPDTRTKKQSSSLYNWSVNLKSTCRGFTPTRSHNLQSMITVCSTSRIFLGMPTPTIFSTMTREEGNGNRKEEGEEEEEVRRTGKVKIIPATERVQVRREKLEIHEWRSTAGGGTALGVLPAVRAGAKWCSFLRRPHLTYTLWRDGRPNTGTWITDLGSHSQFVGRPPCRFDLQGVRAHQQR